MRAIGSSVPRVDAPAKTTGQARYSDDFSLPGQKWMKVVFADVPHARIRRLDVTAAAAMPGVVAVLTDADVPNNRYGIIFPDQPVLCGLNSTPAARTVRWPGDRLCLIIADTPDIAEAAAQRVRVAYDLLPVLVDPEAALAPDAVLIHDYDGYPVPAAAAPPQANVLSQLRIRLGNIRQGLADADVVVSDTYTTHAQEHAYLEPEAGMAWCTEDGRIVVRTGGQWMHDDRHQIAAALQMSETQIQVSYAAIGGAFGGKEDVHLQIVLALAALRTGCPVRCVWSRADSIRYHHKRHPFRFASQLGATRHGRLTGLRVDVLCDAGAYASTSTKVLGNAVLACGGCYTIPHVHIDGRAVFTNNCISGAFRGFGSPQGAFMIETQMNRLAQVLDMDPGALRHLNAWTEGSFMCTRAPVPRGCMAREVLAATEKAACLQEAAPAADARQGSLASTSRRKVRGRGLAMACKNVGFGQGITDSCHAWLELRGGAEIEEVWLGTVGADTGQGAHTVFRQMAADALEVPLARVHLRVQSTDDADSSGSASASRLTYYTGAAIHEAARRARIAWRNEERPARGAYTFATRMTTPFAPETGAGNPAVTFGYCAQIAEVEVDLDTGHITVSRLISSHDVGRAVNPSLVEGQVEGAVAQGIGWTLYEQLVQVEGEIRNPSFSTYLIPGIRDVPDTVVPVIVEGGAPEHPLQIKGMAEMGLVPVAAAVTAAVHDATGVWIATLPLTPETVWRALQKARTGD